MPIASSIKFEAFELILHGLSAYKISQRLGVSKVRFKPGRSSRMSGIFLGSMLLGAASIALS